MTRGGEGASEQRIQGLVFITLVALLVRAILERLCRQRELSFTADRLFHRFAHLQAVDVTWSDGSSQRRAAQMSAFQAHVLDVLDWPRPETYAYRASDSADAHL